MNNTVAGLIIMSMFESCSFSLRPASQPPPTKMASINVRDREITVSKGVAFAIECVDNQDGVCPGLSVSSENTAIADVLPGYLAPVTTPTAVEGGIQNVNRSRSMFVVVGKSPGDATIRITTDRGHDIYQAHIVTP